MKAICILLLPITLLLAACTTGYNRHNGQWVWTTQDEYNGRRDIPIAGIDNGSFKILSNESFGADKYAVYYQGRKIKHAHPESFTTLTQNAFGYAKDGKRVFLDTEVILKADPETFEVLEFPYSKDKNDVYNGTLPMQLEKEEVNSFVATNEDRLMYASKTTSLVTYFLEYSPEYNWIKAYDPELKHIIIGTSGTGKTSQRKFKGLKAIQ
jgi:hypothetical protein